MSEGQAPVPGRWSMRRRDWAMAAWVSFLAASIGTLVIFAVLDPAEFTLAWASAWDIGRRLGYSLGFAFLYGVCFLASGLTVFMIRTGPPPGHAQGRGRRPPPRVHDPRENNPDLDDEAWS